MARFLRLGTLLAMVGVLAASSALAGIVDPALSSVPNLVFCPTADVTYKVTAMSSLGPVVGATIEVRVNTTANGANPKICWCTVGGQATSGGTKKSTTSTVSFTSTTNGVGVAEFKIAAGGCVTHLVGVRFVEVFGNSIKIGQVGAISPDAVDQTGKLPTDTGYAPNDGAPIPAPACVVGLSDTSYLTPAFKGTVFNVCGDFAFPYAVVGLSDVTTFTPHIKGAHACSRL
jgi:hypothetical protein